MLTGGTFYTLNMCVFPAVDSRPVTYTEIYPSFSFTTVPHYQHDHTMLESPNNLVLPTTLATHPLIIPF